MKTWKLEVLAAAMSLAMATAAGAQSTNSKTMPSNGATTPPGATMRSDIPKECAHLTGRAMSDCARDHNPSSMRSKSGTDSTTGSDHANSDARRGTTGVQRNDKSGSGTGATGSSNGASTGTAGTTGSAGSAGTGTGATGSSGTGGAAGGGTGGDTGGGAAGAGGGNGK